MIVYFIQAPRQAGKTRFAIDIFNKKEKITLFSKTNLIKRSYLHLIQDKKKLNDLKIITKNCFRGKRIENLIIDDFEFVEKDNMLDLVPAIIFSESKQAYLFFTEKNNDIDFFFNLLSKNKNHICLKIFIRDFSGFEELAKKMLVFERLKQNF